MPPALHRSVCTSETADVPIGHTHRLLSRTVRPGVLFYGARLARTHAFACRHARCQSRGLHTVSAPPLSRNSSTTRTPNAISLAQWPCQVALQSRRARCSILTRALREDHGLPHSTQSQTANDADIEFAEQMLEEVVQAELGGLTGGGQPISIFSSLDMADMDAIILELGSTVAESAPSPARANDGHSDPVLSAPSPSEVSQSAGFQAATDTAAGGGPGIGDETAGDVGESKAVAWEQVPESSAAAAAELPGKLDTWPALKTVAGLLRPDLGLVFATIIALLSAVFSFLAIPLAIGHFFEVVRTAGQALDPMAAYRPAATILGVSLIFGALANASLTSLTAWIGERFGARLKARLFRIIMARDQTYFDETQKGELIARLTVDVSRMSAAVADNLGQRGVRSLLEVLGAVIVIARLNPGLAVVALALTPLLSRLTRVIVVRTARLAYRQQTAASDAIKFADERLSQARTVRVFAQEDAEVERFDGLLGATYRLAKQAAWLQGVTDGGGRMTINISSLAVLTVGGLLVLKGRLSVGSMLAINVYNTFLAVGLAQLAGSLGDLGRSLGSLQRVMDVLGVTSPATDAGGSTRLPNVKGNLEFKDVHFAYAGRQDLPVLSGMSLKVPAGSSMALVGSSGSGKSTAVALLLRLYEPSSGSILLDGWEVSDMDVQWLRSKVAVVSQEPSLLAGTVADAIRYGRPDASLEEVQTAARAANAHEFIEALPQGYETLVGERGSSLSGGQKQRIAIARAILMDAKVLLLDEATSALDVESEALVSAALKVLMVGRTTLIIAHRLSTVRQADRIAVIAHGKVAEEGTHLQLMQKQDGLYRGFVHQSEASAEAWDSLNGAAAPQIQPMIQAPA